MAPSMPVFFLRLLGVAMVTAGGIPILTCDLYTVSTAMRGLVVSEGVLDSLTTIIKLDCVLACSTRSDCKAVNWVPGQQNNCHLHSSILETPTGSEQTWSSAEYLYRVNGNQSAGSCTTSTGTTPTTAATTAGTASTTTSSIVNVSLCTGALQSGSAARSCQEHYNAGRTTSGVYTLDIGDGAPAFNVYCDMDKDGGGWTVFLNRASASVDFNRTWTECQEGFGCLNGNYWLGLTNIRRLTEAGFTSFRVDASDWAGVWKYAKYSTFRLGTPQDRYRLTLTGYSGDVGAKSLDFNNGGMFATSDMDDADHCARSRGGPWWYKGCTYVQPMSPYGEGGNCQVQMECMQWSFWHGYGVSLKSFRFMQK